MSIATSSKTNFISLSRRFALPAWRWYLGGIVALCITNLIALEIPQLSKDIINNLSDKAKFTNMQTLALAIIGLGALQILIRAISRILIFWPGRQIEAEIKNYYFARFLSLPQKFFQRFGMGDLISRLSNDIGQLRVFYAFAVLQALNLIALSTLTIAKMLSIHAKLTIACLLPLTMMILITKFAMPRFHKYSRMSQDSLGKLSNKVTEAFVNVLTIKCNTAEESFTRKILTHIEEVYQTNIKLLVVRVAIFPSIVLLNGLSYLVVLFYGGHETIAGRLTIGDIMAFNIYIAMLSFPLTAVGIIISIYQRAKTAIERLAELDDETPEAAIPNLNGNHPDDDNIILEVKNLSFQYPKGEEAKGDSDDFVLKQISFQVRQGQKIGITGPVGSGKSTLFEVITRLYDPPPGTIFWRGQDILSLDPQTLRQHIGYTKQNAHLMSDTVANNLAYGTAFRQDQSKLEEAARRASVLHDIEKLPEAWNTEIGERGVRLSGGQKQRLALARIFLREPELLILDDTMSAVDQSTEQRMIQYILASNQTVILTSHRNSALQHCDLIIVMRQGKIDCLGSYETMKKCGDLNFLAS